MNDLSTTPRPTRPHKSLFACSTGGHLTELVRLEERLGVHADSVWVTFDTPQSRSMLQGRRVEFLPYVGPRDFKGTVGAVPQLRRIIRRERFDAAYSTGAAIATAALPLARLHGIPSTYIESVCRLRGPSTTGRLLQRMPGIDLRTQHTAWADRRWLAVTSILSDFRSAPRPEPIGPLKLFVTLGTIRGYRFDSIVDSILQSGLANSETVWQLGDTTRTDVLPGQVHDYLSPHDFSQAAAEADVVITHAGVGTLLEMLNLGIFPIQAVRRAARGEHVDDHQTEIADLVNVNRIGVAVEGPDLTADTIRYAARRRIVLEPDVRTEEPARVGER